MANNSVQYAVCHMQRGNGKDGGLTTHIERKTKDGKDYIPDNADAKRTHLNRELVKFPHGVVDRTQAIQYRIANAGLHRKVGKNQTRDICVMLSGTHERMMEILDKGKLDDWLSANLRWLRQTFGEENVVSCVLHMDETTPHLHATVVPITEAPRERRMREGERKNKVKKGPRLSADDFMTRANLKKYQDSYAKAMKVFGLERGEEGSKAKHMVCGDYYKKEKRRQERELEKTREGKSTILALFDRGDLAEARKLVKEKEKEISSLQRRVKELESAIVQMQRKHAEEKAQLTDSYRKELAKAVREAEKFKKEAETRTAEVDRLKAQIEALKREAHPELYRLSSGAELVHHFIPNILNPSLHIWTKVGDEEFDVSKDIDYFGAVWERYKKGEATIYELINDTFEPQEQVNSAQAQLLGATLMIVSGGPAQARVGTGSGGSQSDLPWNDRDKRRRGIN